MQFITYFPLQDAEENLEHKTDILVFQDISLAMLVTCLLAATTTVLLAWASFSKKEEIHNAVWGTGRFFVPNLRNILFHVFASLLLLTFIHEMGYAFVKTFIEVPEGVKNGFDFFLAAFSGLGGGFVIAKLVAAIKSKARGGKGQ
ncbi:MAG: hypothetical protein AAF717_09010 [Bacteroidota bacterium]